MRCQCRAIPPFVPVLQTGTVLKILVLGLRPRLLMARALGTQDSALSPTLTPHHSFAYRWRETTSRWQENFFAVHKNT
jgi:hypothetical protein